MSSILNLIGLATSPSIETVHGEVRKLVAYFAGSVFVRAELVKIVVMRHVLKGRFFSVVLKGLFTVTFNFVPAWTLRRGNARCESTFPPISAAPPNPIAFRICRLLR